MRVVTGHAGNPGVARCSPAAALLKAVRFKAYQGEADLAIGLDDVRPGAVTGAAEVDRIGRGKIGGIDHRRRLFRIVPGHGRDVRGSGPVARLAGNSRGGAL